MNSDVDKIYLLTEDEEFPFLLPQEIEAINVSGQQFFRYDGPNYLNAWTWMVLMRLALAMLFPNLDRILSLDVDTIVDDDVSDLWDLPIDDCYFAATPQVSPAPANGYVNVGVSLFNLDKLRDGKAQETIDLVNSQKLTWVEQDALNYTCRDKIYPMPAKYNDNNYVCRDPAPKIYHFAAIRNWYGNPLVKKYEAMPWEEVFRIRYERYNK